MTQDEQHEGLVAASYAVDDLREQSLVKTLGYITQGNEMKAYWEVYARLVSLSRASHAIHSATWGIDSLRKRL